MTARAETVTILFTDLVGSTELLQRAGDDDAQRIFKAHHLLLRDVVARHGGHEVKWLGDGLMVAFDSAADGVRAAIEMQQASRRPAAGERLHIRAGLNVGEALRDESDYFGSAVVIARRLCDSGGAGEIRASDLVARLLEERREFSFQDLGEVSLKGITKAVRAWRAAYEHDPLAMLAQAPFVGREEEFVRLRRALATARRGQAAFVMLAGEPGIGKTRLAQEFARFAEAEGALVLTGHCYEGEWAPPLSPFAEALQAYAESVTADELRADLSYQAAVLARLVPALRDKLPEIGERAAGEAGGERARLVESIEAWMCSVAARRPLVLLLDDLHWADDGTAALIAHFAQKGRDHRVLVLGTYRDAEVTAEHPLARALADVRRRLGLERIGLTGLALPEVAALLAAVAADVPSSDVVGALVAETAGNPLFIREVLLHAAERRGNVLAEVGDWIVALRSGDGSVPDGVRDVIVRRVAIAPEEARAMLQAMCVLTSGIELPALVELTGLDEPAVLAAVDEAISARLIAERRRGAFNVLDFQHALIRDALYATLSVTRRSVLHRRMAAAIERACDGRLAEYAAELAHQHEMAGDSRSAIEYSLMAGDRARGAYLNDEAAVWYEHAERLLAAFTDEAEPDWRDSVCARYAEGIADVLLLRGAHDEAQQRLAAALAHTRDDLGIARVCRKRAASFVIQRRYAEGELEFQAATRSLDRARSSEDAGWWFEWIEVQVERMWAHYWQGQPGDMQAIVSSAGERIEAHGSPRQLGRYYQARTALGFRQERYRLSLTTRELAAAALDAVRRAGDTGELGFTHFMLGFTALWMDDFDTAAEQFALAREWTARTRNVTVESRILTYEAVLQRRLGNIGRVRELVSQVLPIATQGQMLEYVGTAKANLGWIALYDDDIENAEQEASGAVETWHRLPITYSFRWTALLVLTDAARRRGRLAAAQEQLRAMLEPTQQLLHPDVMRSIELAASVGGGEAAAAIDDALACAREHRYL